MKFKTINRIFFIIICIFNITILNAQNIMGIDAFLQLVQVQSPLAKQAALAPRRAAEQQRVARGGFDPMVYSYFDDKFFKEKQYFSLFSSGVKIPLPIGEAKIGYDINSGSFLNPEAATPNAGIGALGVAIPLLQGLLIDDRRGAIKQANIGADMAQIDQNQLLRDLQYEAAQAYWDWVQATVQAQTFKDTYILALERLEAVKQSVRNGDRAAIDTTEQSLVARQWQIETTNANMRSRAAQLFAAQFIGETADRNSFASVSPVSLAVAEKLPYSFTRINAVAQLDSLKQLGFSLAESNLLLGLQAYQLKLQQLDIEQRLKQEKLKPKLNVNYNALSEQFNYTNTKYGQFYDNYKLGVQFSYPIFTRTERGGVNLTKIKQEEAAYAQTQKRIELQTKIAMYSNELSNNLQQIRLYNQQSRDYTTLRDAEVAKYQLGDSNIFMVNARDTKLLEAQLKLTELKVKHFKYWAVLQWLLAA